MNLSGKYMVHELHTAVTGLVGGDPTVTLHVNEIQGQDIIVDDRGFWEDICPGIGMRVDAGTIEHR
ncbi:hypothetical protein FRC09_017594, partial [Ceratobasidium sp. 395]